MFFSASLHLASNVERSSQEDLEAFNLNYRETAFFLIKEEVSGSRRSLVGSVLLIRHETSAPQLNMKKYLFGVFLSLS